MVTESRKTIGLRPLEFKPKICTMKIAKDEGWPYSLGGLHRHLFGIPLDGAHDAMTDTKATARIFFELKARKLV